MVLGGDPLVGTLHEALSPAERALARAPANAWGGGVPGGRG